MSLRKRGSVWWIDIATPSGERIRRSTETGNKAQARELHDKLKSEVWRVHKLGDRPRRIWQDAAVRWLREQAHKASIEDDKTKLRWLDRHLAGRELESINRALIDAITEAKLAEGCSNGTVNRVLALVRAILRKCVREWEWLDRAGSATPERAHAAYSIPEPASSAGAVARAASASTRHGDVHAGARTSRCERDRADLGAGRSVTQARVDSSGSGEGEKGDCGSTQRYGDGRRGAQRGKHLTHVFTYEGQPIKQVSTRAWYLALKRAGIEDFRWHELRHTWASWHVQSGTPLFALQELGGWETEKMVRRYAHLAADHLALHAANTKIHGTNTAQPADFPGTARLQVVGN